ncbi:MAG: MFS transporter [Pseudomonadales bacterium]|jgi:MFS family permease|nr:MFS transporter [Pseudomonadales bacterium]
MEAQQGNRLARNLGAIRALAFFQVFMVVVPVAVPLFGDRGLDLAEILQLQAAFGITVLLAEVPSGYVADLWGRRLALVAGALCLGIGHTILVFAQDFWSLVLFEVALGVAVSLISGADIAVLYDTQLALGHDETTRQRGLGQLFFLRATGEAGAGLAAAVLLLFAGLNELVLLQAIVGWLPLGFALAVVEPPGERLAAGAHLENLGGVLRALLANGAVLRLTFLALGVWSLVTYYAVWLLQQHWQDQGVPLVVFGIMWAVLAAVAAVAGRYAATLEEILGPGALLMVVALLPAVGYFALAGLPGAAGLLVAPLFFAARGAGFVVLQQALNRRLDSRHRATANSLASFLFRGLFAATVPVIGGLLRVWSPAEVSALLGAVALAVGLGLVLPLVMAVQADGLRRSEGEPAVQRAGA